MTIVGRPCPVCIGLTFTDCGHPPALVAAAVARNAAIDTAGRVFAAARDRLARSTKGDAFRAAIAPHERTLDSAKDAAWAEFHWVAWRVSSPTTVSLRTTGT